MNKTTPASYLHNFVPIGLACLGEGLPACMQMLFVMERANKILCFLIKECPALTQNTMDHSCPRWQAENVVGLQCQTLDEHSPRHMKNLSK